MARPSPAGFGISRVLGSAAPSGQRGGIGTASACEPAKRNRVAPRPNLFFGAVAPSGSRGRRRRSGSWLRQEVPPPLRQRCHLLCPMRPGHARDNCRHIEIHLPAVGDLFGGLFPSPSTCCSQPTATMTASTPMRPQPKCWAKSRMLRGPRSMGGLIANRQRRVSGAVSGRCAAGAAQPGGRRSER